VHFSEIPAIPEIYLLYTWIRIMKNYKTLKINSGIKCVTHYTEEDKML
jgi:hypothetical protein